MLTNEELPSHWILRRVVELQKEHPEHPPFAWQIQAIKDFLDQAALDSHPPFRHSQEV